MYRFNRIWAMPSLETFNIKPIGEFVKRYLRDAKISIDPFARNKRWATYTNDLNQDTNAEYHLDCLDFLQMLINDKIMADLVIFDPPYSPTQIKECYNSIGLDRFYRSGEENWLKERDAASQLLSVGGKVLSFGWNSQGMGKERFFHIEEILLVPHGAAHNDTICLAEIKYAHQLGLFDV